MVKPSVKHAQESAKVDFATMASVPRAFCGRLIAEEARIVSCAFLPEREAEVTCEPCLTRMRSIRAWSLRFAELYEAAKATTEDHFEARVGAWDRVVAELGPNPRGLSRPERRPGRPR